MWNFLVSGLTIGCTLVLYDGSPLHDPAYLWRLVDELGITIFGTSAKYIDQLAVRFSCTLQRCSLTLSALYCCVTDCVLLCRKCINLRRTTDCQLSGTFTPQARPWRPTCSTLCTNTSAATSFSGP